MASNLYTLQSDNVKRTWLLFIAFFIVVVGIGYVFWQVYSDPSFIIFAVLFSVIYSFVSYYASASIALRLASARQIQKSDNPQLWNIVENLCIADGIPMPKLYITPEMQINAFATGRNQENAAVAVTQGALDRLTKTEMEGVIAHELSHVKNKDILVSTVAAVLAGIISLLADIFLRSIFLRNIGGNRRGNNEAQEAFFIFAIVLSILAPIGTALIQLAISRRRESLADASGVLLTRYPEGLISALEKNRPRYNTDAKREGFNCSYVARQSIQGYKSFMVAHTFHDSPTNRAENRSIKKYIGLITLLKTMEEQIPQNPNEPVIEDVTTSTIDYIKANYIPYVIAYIVLSIALLYFAINQLTIIVVIMVGVLGYSVVYGKIKKLFTQEFGQSIGFTYSDSASVESASGKLFQTGHSQKMSDVLSGTYQNNPMRIFSFTFTVGYGRDSHTYSYTVIEATITGILPDILLCSKAHGTAVSDWFSGDETVELEGDFNKYFRLRVPKNFEQETYQIFTPDVMANLIDKAKDLSFEFVENKIYIYATKIIGNRTEMYSMFNLSEYLINLFKRNTSGIKI